MYYFDKNCERGKYPGTNINCLKVKTANGSKFILAFGTNTQSANNSWHGFRVSGFLIDEIDRCHKNSIEEMQQRITAVKHPFIICTQNPNIEKHPVYEFLNNLEEKNLVNYSHWKLDDNIALSKEKIAAIKNMYDPASVYYKRYINGERVNPNGQVYNINSYNILDSFNPDEYMDYIIVCDQGESISASVFILAALKYNMNTREYCLDILKHYYYKNDGKFGAQVKMFKDTADDLSFFVKECCDLMKKYPSVIYIDQDPEFYRNVELEFRENKIYTNNIKYVIKDDIDQRIKSGTNLLYKGRLRFYKSCNDIVEDFRNAVYDNSKIEKSGKFERLKEYSERGHLDGIDAVEYAFTHYKNKLYIK